MRKKIVAGNWKMNTTVSEGLELAKAVVEKSAEVPASVKLIIAPPFTHLVPVAEIVKGSAVGLSAQNCADKESGAYTGEVSVKMLASAGCEYVVLGHSERRQYYGETDAKLVEKVKLAIAQGLSPIFCIGENLEEREAGRHFEVVSDQIKNVLYTLSAEEMAKVIVAYEPVWAIGTGKTATAEQAQESTLVHVRYLLTNSVLLPRRSLSFTAEAASLQMQRSFLPVLILTEVLSEVLLSRLKTLSESHFHSKSYRTVPDFYV